jgi:hypothetical protein
MTGAGIKGSEVVAAATGIADFFATRAVGTDTTAAVSTSVGVLAGEITATGAAAVMSFDATGITASV